MSRLSDTTERDQSLADARREGAAIATRRATKLAAGVVALAAVLLFATVGVGWTLATRAQAAAPEVIEELATERQAAMEARIAARSHEAQILAGRTFEFLLRVWEDNEALRGIRADLDAATTQMRLLTGEVNAAFDSPTKNLGALLENGPTRAHAVLDHALAVGAELRRLVPLVLAALNEARQAADADAPALPAILAAMDALLEPFIGTNIGLAKQWASLKTDLLAWTGRIADDFERARVELAGDELSDEFLRRLRVRVL